MSKLSLERDEGYEAPETELVWQEVQGVRKERSGVDCEGWP